MKAFSPSFIAHLLCCLLFLSAGYSYAQGAEKQLQQTLAQNSEAGAVILIRHALAPGTGDPANFTLGDCSTQRNLSAEGREQARRLGVMLQKIVQEMLHERVQETGAAQVALYSSQWCRCIETAALMQLGTVKPLPLLNSFFREGDPEDRQTRQLANWISQQPLTKTLVLVTHQVNITALTGVYPSSGEMVFVHRSERGLEVVTTLDTL